MKILTSLKEKASFLFLIYLRELSKLQLKKVNPQIVGITGSAGKTSLRNAIAAALKDKFRVKVSIKANSESGIPLNILGLTPIDYSVKDWLRLALLAPLKLLTNWEGYDYYIAELGIDRPDPPKNMEYLLTIVKPQIGVFLNVLPVHSEYFDDRVSESIKDPKKRRELIANLIAAEKGKLIRTLPKSGAAVLNTDDSRVRPFVRRTKARVITFATEGRADLTASNIESDLQGFSMQIRENNSGQKLKINQLLDKHFAQTLLGAVAVGRACGISLSTCVSSLEKNFHLPPGRMSVIPGIKGTTILDSSYNASRVSMISALRLLKEVSPSRKVAVLGDMRELGRISKQEHVAVAKLAAEAVDIVISVGPMMKKWLVPELIRKGFPEEKVKSYINPFEAAHTARELVRKGDTILVKGSQNTIFLEIVVRRLMRNPQDAKRFLCRRGKFWDEKRAELKRH